MSKLFFRFLRGELNGYYLSNLHDTLNSAVEETRSVLASFKRMQFDENMDSETLFNIGKFASVFLPRKESPEKRNTLLMSESHIVDGEERSERGLYNTDEERFEFKHTTDSPDLPDINTLTTQTLRSSLVGDEEATGYISSTNEDVFDDEGNVKPSAILSSPPSGEAYSEYYGGDFLFLSEGVGINYESINPQLYKSIYESLQWIRYNGVSLASLLRITEILCPEGLVKIQSITVAQNKRHWIVHYTYNADLDIGSKAQRVFLFEYLIGLKFKQCALVQSEGE